MKKIALLNLGGTITSVADPKTGKLQSGTLTGKQLIEQCHLGDLGIDLEIKDIKSIPSPEMKCSDILDIKKAIEETLKENVDGIVLTHGTDTMEETSYMLDLLLSTEVPVVLTGSQRSAKDLGFDGAPNIRDAIIVASDEMSRKRGVLVVFNQEVFCAKRVIKTNSAGLGGFSDPVSGPMGAVYGAKVKYFYDYTPDKAIKILDEPLTNKVYLIKMTLDFPIEMLETLLNTDVKGLVVEGFGVGAVVPGVQDVLEKYVNKNIPVILVSKCHTGGVWKVYGSKGAAVQLEKVGCILDEGYLQGPKARLKLIAMLNSEYKDSIRENWNR
ncbi:asparaginase [uncultured Peptoniphilus sp.]|uniref:asparaginase n=1 Tax=uncultured Peptoniphilus sp. TaxID=254354 RepID=UPI0028062725|nr:asparaginase [uncultured Peptoniphilus sp.]